MIYYKIFLTRSVTDIGAFAPRDYTREYMTDPKVKNLHGFSAPVSDKSLWYQRAVCIVYFPPVLENSPTFTVFALVEIKVAGTSRKWSQHVCADLISTATWRLRFVMGDVLRLWGRPLLASQWGWRPKLDMSLYCPDDISFVSFSTFLHCAASILLNSFFLKKLQQENNGWRPVTKMWFAVDAVAVETAKKVRV